MKTWVNGEIVDQLNLPATNSGWLMGDGIFESLRTYDSQPFALQRHLQRLASSAEEMAFTAPDLDLITKGVFEIVAVNKCEPYGRLRITLLSDGFCVITHIPYEARHGALSLAFAHSPQSSQRVTSGVKTISYAENSVALRRAQAQGHDDAIFVNEKNEVVETALANVIWFDGRIWKTPPLTSGCLPGVTRALLIENFGVVEESIHKSDVSGVQALAITSSVREVVAIERLESKLFPPSQELSELQGSFHAWILGNLGV